MSKKELFYVFILNIINMITGEYIFEPYVKIDEASSDEIYVGFLIMVITVVNLHGG